MITRVAIALGALLALGLVHLKIVAKEDVLKNGRVVLLELAPVDPRSLMQGDYMILNYALNRDKKVRAAIEVYPAQRGKLVLKLDGNKAGTFARIDDGTELADNEVRLLFRKKGRWNRIFVAPESFFFQEGEAERYEEAKFSEIRVAEDGTCVLAALCDETKTRIN